MMNLVLLIVMPIFAAALVAAAPERRAKWIALGGTLLPVVWFVKMAFEFSWTMGSGDMLAGMEEPIRWFAPLGITISLNADVVSMLLIGLTVLLGPICVGASFAAITERVKTYYAWLLILQGAMVGVFAARDIILFYVFFEFTLVPLYILINLFGSTNRRAAATKFFLYTFTGSLITLAGLVYIAWVHASRNPADGLGGGGWSFEFATLASTAQNMSSTQQAWVFWALLAGFAVKVPLFPLHTWLPVAHTEAPTAGSVILAGVLLKLGTYGIYRFALGFCPAAAIEFAPVLAGLSVVGILYAGLICWVQTDVKKLVAYSSVSHLGFCILGLFALNTIGLSGSILYMINHGLSTGALFLLIGMVYERYHTRSMKELGGLGARMPVWSTFMVFFAMASVGLPGLNGFISEFMCLLGAFQAGGAEWASLGGAGGMPVGATWGNLGWTFALLAGVGMIVTAIYILFMVGKIVWGPLVEPHHGEAGHGKGDGHGEHGGLPRDLCGREIGVLIPLAVGCIVLGIYPTPILRALEEPTRVVAQQIQAQRVRDGLAPEPVGGGAVEHSADASGESGGAH